MYVCMCATLVCVRVCVTVVPCMLRRECLAGCGMCPSCALCLSCVMIVTRIVSGDGRWQPSGQKRSLAPLTQRHTKRRSDEQSHTRPTTTAYSHPASAHVSTQAIRYGTVSCMQPAWICQVKCTLLLGHPLVCPKRKKLKKREITLSVTHYCCLSHT